MYVGMYLCTFVIYKGAGTKDMSRSLYSHFIQILLETHKEINNHSYE
jgi:hypothetical protein